MAKTAGRAAGATGLVLLTLAAGQFVMALDTTVMNTAIATVAKDVNTTVTGIQTAITLYALVMASLMITGGKVGEIVGRKRAFTIGCVIYACGSLTTALSQGLPMLLFGWSLLEGLGAVLIMPAIVALVASNFDKPARPRAYGLVMAAGAIAAALGPLIGGFFTTYASWRWVFVGEVLIVAAILMLARRVKDTPAEEGTKLDLFGTLLSALGLGLIVFGILKSGVWGVVQPKPEAPQWIGLSPVIWLILGGLVVLALFLRWETLRIGRGEAALIDPKLLHNIQLRSGVISFLFMFLVQMGTFFVVPLYLSVALGLSAMETGVRVLPMSLGLLVFAIGVPKLAPDANPRRVVNAGFVLMFAGLVLLIALLDIDAGPEVVTGPLLVIGSGLGAMASQLGSVTVSAVPRGAERRGRGPAEHGHPARRGDRHRARRRDPHLRADRRVLQRRPEQPGDPRQPRRQRTGPARDRRAVRVRQTAAEGARRRQRPTRDRQSGRRREHAGPDRGPALSPRGAGAHQPARPALHPRHPDDPARRRSQAERAAHRNAGRRLTLTAKTRYFPHWSSPGSPDRLSSPGNFGVGVLELRRPLMVVWCAFS